MVSPVQCRLQVTLPVAFDPSPRKGEPSEMCVGRLCHLLCLMSTSLCSSIIIALSAGSAMACLAASCTISSGASPASSLSGELAKARTAARPACATMGSTRCFVSIAADPPRGCCMGPGSATQAPSAPSVLHATQLTARPPGAASASANAATLHRKHNDTGVSALAASEGRGAGAHSKSIVQAAGSRKRVPDCLRTAPIGSSQSQRRRA